MTTCGVAYDETPISPGRLQPMTSNWVVRQTIPGRGISGLHKQIRPPINGAGNGSNSGHYNPMVA